MNWISFRSMGAVVASPIVLAMVPLGSAHAAQTAGGCSFAKGMTTCVTSSTARVLAAVPATDGVVPADDGPGAQICRAENPQLTLVTYSVDPGTTAAVDRTTTVTTVYQGRQTKRATSTSTTTSDTYFGFAFLASGGMFCSY